MAIFLDENIRKFLVGKRGVLDNDFLNAIFNDDDLFVEISELFSGSYFVYDQITVFEFFRDIFIPKQQELREIFLSRERFFPLTDHQEIYQKTKNNAIILSRIYAHKQHKSASFVDIFLAARMMMLGDKFVLITGNKRDYPSFIFNTKGVITKEVKDGALRSYSVLSFSPEKFDKCFEELKMVKKQI